MTQDEIIRMAREAGIEDWVSKINIGNTFEFDRTLERFAALVAANEREKQSEQEPVAWMWKPSKPFPQYTVITDNKEHLEAAKEQGVAITPLYAAPQPVKQEPVGTLTVSKYKGYENGSFDYYGDLPVGSHNLYAAPVRTKDLTDDEINELIQTWHKSDDGLFDYARAVIAADRKKNK